MLKWALLLVGSLAALVVVPMAGGMFLPRQHVVTSEAVLSQPIDSVWMVVSDLDDYPGWWSDVKSMERQIGDSARVSWIQRDAQGQELPIELVTVDPPRYMEARIANRQLPFSGTWSYSLESTASGTRISVTEDGEVFNPVFRFLARFVFGYHGTIDRYIVALGSRFGEDVVPVHVSRR